MTASFPTNIKSFSAKTDGVDDVMAADINDLQDEVAAIEGYGGGWTPAGETWTYASSTTFTVSGNQTGKYQKGDKVKLTQTTVKYFYITNVVYSSPNTTVTVSGGDDYSLANAAITLPYYSKAVNPQGFPRWFRWTPTLISTGATFTYTFQTGTFAINNGLVVFEASIQLGAAPGGTTSNSVSMGLPFTAATISNSRMAFSVYWSLITLPANMTVLTSYVASSLAVATLRYTGSGQTAAALLASGMVNGTVLQISGQYFLG